MPAKEIKELRQAGKLEDALKMAKAELGAQPDNIWAKRNISWVYYDHLKLNSSVYQFDAFLSWLTEIDNLKLPAEEKMLYEQLSWQVGKMVFTLLKAEPVDVQKIILLFDTIKSISFSKPTNGYSFLFKAFHKGLKESEIYINFADWWDLQNFMPEDFQKEKLENGREIMAIAEQAYIAYSKHLLPKQIQNGEILFDREKVLAFLPVLSEIVDSYPQFQYPAYFHAKLLLALGDNDNMLGSLLPFAKKKRNDFWVWEILAEAFSNEPDKVFACYCKALSCKSPEEMLVSLRQKMSGLLIAKKLFNEAKTEIELLVNARHEHGFRIPNEVANWQVQEWYKNAIASKSNFDFYKEYVPSAESLLFSDIPEEMVFVEFVNSDKKILNFIASESKFGFFKYDRFLKDVKVGETLKVRFQGGSNGGMYQVYTAVKAQDNDFKSHFMKQVSGVIKIPSGKAFGFLEDVFVHPAIITRMKLSDGAHLEGLAIKSYNQEKEKWTWKIV